ncbi:MAG: ATP-binding protein [Candidatus Omnitrophota bacterium]
MKIFKKNKRSIKYEITLLICSVVLIVMLIGMGLWYWWGTSLLRNTVGEDHAKMAELLAFSIDEIINHNIMDIENNARDPYVSEALAKNNLKYEGMNNQQIAEYLKSMEEKWQEIKPEETLNEEYLNMELNANLKNLMQEQQDIVEIIIVDKFGGLVASSSKQTENYYYAGKIWWKKVVHGGKGNIFIGERFIDQMGQGIFFRFIMPIKDASGNLLGFSRSKISVEELFFPLNKFRVGKTGHAVVIDENGNILYHPDVGLLLDKYSPEENYKRLLKGNINWSVFYVKHHQQNRFVAIAGINNALLMKQGLNWYVFLSMDTKEVYSPIYKLTWIMLAVVILLMIIMVPLGFFFGGIFIKPIQTLHNTALKVKEGDLDQRVDIKTNDEIGDLADAFNNMLIVLKQQTNQLQEWAGTLEKKVEQRTKDLGQAQEATLNMLADLQETKTQIERYALDLERSNKDLEQFAYVASHDLREPLRMITSYLQLIEKKYKDRLDKEGDEFISFAIDGAKRMYNLINDLLVYSRAGTQAKEFNPVDCEDIIEEVLVNLKLKIEENKAVLTCEKLPVVMAERMQLVQLFQNLIDNAIKFRGQEAPRVHISAQKDKDNWLFSVKDNGIGIEAEYTSRIFQIFQTLHSRKDYQGTGIGLAVCKKIVERLGGKIWMVSEPDKGSTFYFTIPQLKTEQA